MKKLKTQFKVVGLEEVFKTAIEVNGTPVMEDPSEPRRRNPPSQPHGNSLDKQQQKEE